MAAIRTPCDEGIVHAAPEARPSSGRTARAVLTATILGSGMTFIDGSVVNVALPILRERLAMTDAQVQWVIEAYMLFLSALLLVGGSAGDRFGHRRVFAIGTLLFGAASAGCGAAWNATQLILARGAQGVAAAILVPGSLALISANFSKQQRGRAIGTWAGFSAITAGLGPLLGAWAIQHASWRWIFLLNLPLAAIVLVIVAKAVPESLRPRVEGPLDWAGAMLATAGLFGVTSSLIEAGTRTPDRVHAGVSLAIGAAALGAFVFVESRRPNAMMPLGLFRSQTFTGANLVTFFLYSAMGATTFVLPFTLIEKHGYSPVEAAAAQLPFVFAMFVLSRPVSALADRFGARPFLTAGPAVTALGFVLFRRVDGGGYWADVFPAILMMSLGMSVSVAPLTTTVMTSTDERWAGTASGINNAVSRTAILLAVAIAGIVIRGSFAGGLQRVAWLSAALSLLAAVTAALLVERRRSSAITRMRVT